MIIFKETNSDTNIIHLIYGPETDFQLDISGHIVIPLNDKLESGKNNFIYLNKCLTTEEELHEQFDYYSNSTINSKITSPNSNSNEKVAQKPLLKNGYTENLKCPKCLSWGTFIEDGIVTMCKICKEIEKNMKIEGPLSSTKENKKLLKNFIKNFMNDKERKN